MAAFLPSGLRIEGYRPETEQLRTNIVGKTDRHYYSHLLTGYYEISNDAIRPVNFM